MTRRKIVKSIASGLAGSFVSRNNDLDGYWGMGKLCLLCSDSSIGGILIDLTGDVDNLGNNTIVSSIRNHYSAMLRHMLSKANVDPSLVKSATVNVVFGTAGELPEPTFNTWGDVFLCTVEIVDDLGRSHRVSLAGRCGPHDAKRESRSARAARF
jgi:hypothetical protein